MGVATLEDLQGSIEVVVFPRLYEQTAPTWADGAILLVAGRIDHRGDEVSVLADLVTDWDDAVARGPEAYARELAAGDRGRMGRRPGAAGGGPAGSGGPASDRNGHGAREPVPVGPGRSAEAPEPARPGMRPGVPYVSPLRQESRVLEPPAVAVGSAAALTPGAIVVGAPADSPPLASATFVPELPSLRPAEPIPTYAEPPGLERIDSDRDVEPALPDEARERAAEAASDPTAPLDASPGSVLHVRFTTLAAADRLVPAMEAFKRLLRERPGTTRVVVHVPAPGGTALPMELRGVAYDAELLAEVRRRLGDGVVELSLA
jgi:hypothetical protein